MKKVRINFCSIRGCGDRVAGRGLCKAHYQIARRSGSLPNMKPRPQQAFMAKLTKGRAKRCITWPFAIDSKGYASLGRNKRAHRVICEARHGRPPASRPLACHSCGNRWCVNPNHLYWGTYKNNAEDSVRHGASARGERNGHAKLTESDVAAIRASKLGGRRLGKHYGVAPSLIWSIRHRLVWKHTA